MSTHELSNSSTRFPKEYAPLVPTGLQAKITPKDEDKFIVQILEKHSVNT